jgi:hypothetical protein
LDLARNNPIQFQQAESEVLNLYGTLIQHDDEVDPLLIRGAIEWMSTILQCGHFHCLPSISTACSAIIHKCREARLLLLTSGLLPTLQSLITMDKRPFWECILDVIADYTSLPDDPELLKARLKPSVVSFAAGIEICNGGPAACSALNLMSTLIGLYGIDAIHSMDVEQVFRMLLLKTANLGCTVKQSGLILALNVIWCGCEELVEMLFESGLALTLGEALSTETGATAAGFAMATIEKHIQRKVLSEKELEFVNVVAIPFLQECCERDEEAVAVRARALLGYIVDGPQFGK